mmetsp:Transcript_1477/g.2369  ORF Transcript_1477/g.2369 Transcript_1477/m.2369 type:complete len:186 (+) Transcript_1477:68-625(+)
MQNIRKRKAASLTIQTNHLPKFAEMRMPQSAKHGKSQSRSDPFSNMRYSGKSTPKLLPVCPPKSHTPRALPAITPKKNTSSFKPPLPRARRKPQKSEVPKKEQPRRENISTPFFRAKRNEPSESDSCGSASTNLPSNELSECDSTPSFKNQENFEKLRLLLAKDQDVSFGSVAYTSWFKNNTRFS